MVISFDVFGFLKILALVLYRSVGEEVGSPGFVCDHITAMALILEDAQYRTGCPLVVATLGDPLEVGQRFCDLLHGVAVKEHKEDQPDGQSFVLVDHQIAVLVLIVAQQFRCKENASAETHLIGEVHCTTLGAGFLLGKGGNEG